MPHPRTMLQRETWALRTFHPCYQMIKPESQESLACPVTDDELNFYFYEWYGRWSDPSEPRSETHWVMFNLSSFRVRLWDDVQRSHVTRYTAIMQWSIEWSVIRQSSQTFLPNSHTDLAEYCRGKHSRSLVFSSLNNICKKATVNNAMSIQVYVALKQMTHNCSEDTFQNRWTYIFGVRATTRTTKKASTMCIQHNKTLWLQRQLSYNTN